MNLPRPSTLTRKPGFAPFDLPLSMSHSPSFAFLGSSTLPHEPFTSWSIEKGFFPMRFSNQLESGTSSRLLTLIDSPPGSTAQKREIGRNTRLSAASHANEETYSSGTHFWCLGSSGVGSGRHATLTGF